MVLNGKLEAGKPAQDKSRWDLAERCPRGVSFLPPVAVTGGDPNPGLTAPRGESILHKKLFVGNLPYDATADELREMFTPYGRVLSATIASDRETGEPRGFGFVELAEGAEEAIQALNQAQFGGRRLTVNEAKPREDGRRGGQGSGSRGGSSRAR